MNNSSSPESVNFLVTSTPFVYGTYTVLNTGGGDNIDSYCGIGSTLSACQIYLAGHYGCATSGSPATNCAWTNFTFVGFSPSSTPVFSISSSTPPNLDTTCTVNGSTTICDYPLDYYWGYLIDIALVCGTAWLVIKILI